MKEGRSKNLDLIPHRESFHEVPFSKAGSHTSSVQCLPALLNPVVTPHGQPPGSGCITCDQTLGLLP